VAGMTRPFRFGVLLSTALNRRDWLDRCQRAEQFGFDIVAVPDHLAVLAPFAALVAAAGVTTRVQTSAVAPPNSLKIARCLCLARGHGAGKVCNEFSGRWEISL